MRNRLANSLAALGVGAGQHAVIYAHNSAENIVAAAALRALGAIPVPMNHRLTAEEVAYILDDSDAATVFVGDAFLPMAERVRPGATGVKRWITLGAERRAWARRWTTCSRAAAASRRRHPRPWAGRWSTRPAPRASPRARCGGSPTPPPSCRVWRRSTASIPRTSTWSPARSTTRRPAASRSTPTWSAPRSSSCASSTPRTRCATSSATGAPPRSWRPRSSSASWTCRPPCARATTSGPCARSSSPPRPARCA